MIHDGLLLADSRNLDQDLCSKGWEVIENSFPLAEQRPFSEHIRALGDSAFHPELILDEGRFVGVLFYWVYDQKYSFVEHFAIDSSLRGRGYGERSMRLLLAKGYVTILEIDPPVDEISERRRRFYENIGYMLNDQYLHIHPSYRPETEPHELKVMSYPRLITIGEFTRFRDYSLNHILKYVTK